MGTTITVTEWMRESRRSRNGRVIADEANLSLAIQQLAKCWSAEISIQHADGSLAIAFSSGRTCLLAEDMTGRFFDFVGSPDAVGEVAFVSGGQEVTYDARLCCDIETAKRVALRYLRELAVGTEDSTWEPQE